MFKVKIKFLILHLSNKFFPLSAEYLFSPSNGESKLEKAVQVRIQFFLFKNMHISLKFGTYSGFFSQDEYFPSNFSAFDPGRMSSLGCMGRIIARYLLQKNIFFAELTFVVLFKLGGKRATGPAVIIQRC